MINKDLPIKVTDKERAVVIMESKQYEQTIYIQINDKNT